MGTIVINADPKRRKNTAKLMKSAANGAESVGSEIEYVDLYKLDLSGCRVCLTCKKEEDETCKCYWRDELSPLIERILDSDALLIGVPIFFSQPSSHYLALLERLIYCMVSYKTGNKFKGKVNVGLFYTINYSKDYFEQSIRPHLKLSEDLLKMLNGELIINSVYNISKNESSKKDLESQNKVKLKEKEFNNDLKKAFDIGAKLSK